MAKDSKEQDAIELRRYAEKKLAERLTAPQHEEDDTTRLLHELQVHQIELETQNEQLRQVQIDLETSLTRFTQLYEFAPVGYLTLTAAGYVDESNHTAAAMLGEDWAKLLRRRFDPFVVQEDIARWYRFFSALLQDVGNRTQSIQLTLSVAGDRTIHAQMNCVHFKTGDAESKVRVAITELGAPG